MATELRADSIHIMFTTELLKAGLRFVVVPQECLHPDYVAEFMVVYVIGKGD